MPKPGSLLLGVAGPRHGKSFRQENGLEKPAEEGESPVSEGEAKPSGIPSRTEHVKLRPNPGGPSPKAEH